MSQNIESLDNRPWVPHHIPNPIRRELYRRILDQGFNYVNTDNSWTSYKSYRGPLSAWIRVTSNGTGISKPLLIENGLNKEEYENRKKEGFVLYGGQGFHDAFGTINFKDAASPYYQSNILGYETTGKPHVLDLDVKNPNIVILNGNPIRNAPILFPPPGIVSVEASMQKERIRKVTINWKCYSFAQLEYMTPYFLTPGISLIVEFGWNLFNQDCLLDLKDTVKLTNLWKDGTPLYQKTLDSNGMYDATFGMIANFEFGTQDGTTYDCKTEIYSKHRNHTGALMNESATVSDITTTKEKEKDKVIKFSMYDFCNQRLRNVSKCLEGKGKNFFDPLTKDEENKKITTGENAIGYNNEELKKKFLNGNPENRIFIGRDKKEIKNDPLIKENGGHPTNNDWDNNNTTDTWITMGFVVDLINLFIGQNINTFKASDNPKFELFTFNIDDVVIGAHPNLLSSDGYKILIPNPMAPKYNLGAYIWKSDSKEEEWKKNEFQSQTSYKKTATFEKLSDKMQLYNKKLYDIFKTGYGIDITTETKKIEETATSNLTGNYFENLLDFYNIKQVDIEMSNAGTLIPANTLGSYRNDIDSIINRFRYNFFNTTLKPHDAAFPQMIDYTEKGNERKAGYWGYLKDLFVHVDVVINAAKNAKTAEDFLTSLLQTVSAASVGLWELAVIEDENKLRIIDKKFISKKMFQNLYQFDISSDSCIKSLSFTVTPSNAQMTQVIAGSSNNQGLNTGQSTATQLPDFKFGDRLGTNQLLPEKKKTFIDEAADLIKQYQKGGKVTNTFAMSLKYGKDYYEVVNLTLPNKNLLLALLDCGDYEDNLNIYGGQQQNFTCELVLQGIAGLRTFQCFSIKNLPKPYSPEDVIFQIIDLTHSIQNGEWITTIKAGIRPRAKLKTVSSANYQYSNGKEAFESTNDVPIINLK